MHKPQIQAASRSLPCGPCAPCAESEGNEGYAAQRWQRCYPGYRLKPQQLKRWVQWCLGNKRVKMKGYMFQNISNRNSPVPLKQLLIFYKLFVSFSISVCLLLSHCLQPWWSPLFLILYFSADRSNIRMRESHALNVFLYQLHQLDTEKDFKKITWEYEKITL